jgi:tetratricopeptide (TPR) repeat protein
MIVGDLAQAEVVLAEAIDAAAAVENSAAGARARIVLADLRYTTGSVASQELRREAEEAIRALEAAGDDLGLAKAWRFLGSLEHGRGLEVAAQEGWERSIEHARRAGSRWDEIMALDELMWVAVWGPTPRTEALRRCDRLLEEVKDYPEFGAKVLSALSCLRALEGRFDEARALNARRTETLNELGLVLIEAWGSYAAGWVEMLAGDAAAAEGLLQPSYETLEELGATGSLQVVGSYLAQAICMQGRFAEAERLALAVEQLFPTSVAEVALARCARAKASAALGRLEEGERLAREAVALTDQTEFLVDRADARMDLAEVLLLASRPNEAVEVLQDALRLHEQKENLVSAERARALLDKLGR